MQNRSLDQEIKIALQKASFRKIGFYGLSIFDFDSYWVALLTAESRSITKSKKVIEK